MAQLVLPGQGEPLGQGLFQPGQFQGLQIVHRSVPTGSTCYLLWSVEPVSGTSPDLRAHQTWYAEVTGARLKQRRDWR